MAEGDTLVLDGDECARILTEHVENADAEDRFACRRSGSVLDVDGHPYEALVNHGRDPCRNGVPVRDTTRNG
jgi:hypothetical protein